MTKDWGYVTEPITPRNRLLVVDNHTQYMPELLRSITLLEIDHDVVRGSVLLPIDVLAEYAGAVLTGGKAHVYRPEELGSVALGLRILEATPLPVLGICLGHQLLAFHYGARVEPLPAPVKRTESIELVRSDPLFAGLPAQFDVRVGHDDAVGALPETLVCLARSSYAEESVIRHRSRPAYGLQFHPEASSDPGLMILRNFASLCAQRPAGDPRRPQPLLREPLAAS